MRETNRRGAFAILSVVVTAALLGGCSGSDDEPESGPTPAPSASASSEPEVVTAVKVGTVTGRLPAPDRKKVADQVGEVVDGWYDAAYLGGPKAQGGPAWAALWPGFTRGAAAQARQDADLTSAQQDGEVTAGSKGVRVDILAVHQKAAGVTAHVFLRYPSGDQSVRVTGRLYLSPSAKGWHVFGYDLAKGAAR